VRRLGFAAAAALVLLAIAPSAGGGTAANRDVARFLDQVRGKRTLVVAFHPF
jgi:hypothetical protein